MDGKILTIKKLCDLVAGQLCGSDEISLSGINSIDAACDQDLTFLSDEKYFSSLQTSNAGAVLVSTEYENVGMAQVVVGNVDEALITVLEYFQPKYTPESGIHSSAVVSDSATIAVSASIGANAVIGDDVIIGENTIISSGCHILSKSKVGANCKLDSNVVIYDNCTIGNYCVILANTTIGSMGFGYRAVNNMPKLIPHLGGVILEDFVEIGANCTIDRAKFGNTVIGMATKIDNLVQIAHNCVIGKCCMIAAFVGIAGSSVLGDGVIIGGQAGVGDHATIGDGAMLAGGAGVIGYVAPGAKVFGYPARDMKQAQRVLAHTNRLPQLAKTVKELKKKVEKLEAAKDNS